MNELREIRLVNWHAFQDQSIPMSGSTLLAGTNATGKTTILDAVQYAMIADQTRVQFNRKASEKNRRTLAGYVRWMTLENAGGSEDRGGRYHRGACTAYIVLRFENTADGTSFVCGVGIYAGESDQIGDQVLFIVPRCSSVAELALVEETNGERMVIGLRQVRAALRERNAHIIASAEAYRTQLAGYLGHIPSDYFRAFVRTISTRPLGELEDFMKDFILEEREVETAELIENVNNYQRYLREAQETTRRVGALETVDDAYTHLTRAKGEYQKVRFRYLEANREVSATSLNNLRTRIEGLEEEREALDAKIKALESALETRRAAQWDAFARYQKSEGAATLEQLERERVAVERELESARSARERAITARESMNVVHRKLTSQHAAKLRDEMGVYIGNDPFADRELMEKVEQFLTDEEPDGRRARSWSRAVDGLRTCYERAFDRADTDRGRLAVELKALEDERASDKVVYPDHIAATFDMLNTRLSSTVVPLAELIDVRDEKWRIAIEAELGGLRFAAIVPGDEYRRATRLIEEHRSGWRYGGRTQPIYGVRIVHMTGVRGDRRRARPDSLAEQITTDNEDARAYIDFLLGDVMCVEHRDDLVNHRRAITPLGLTHRQHGTSTSNPASYARQYIGAAAAERRRREVEEEAAMVRRRIEDLDALLRFATDAIAMASEQAPRLGAFLADAEAARAITILVEKIRGIRERMELLKQDATLARLAEEHRRLEQQVRSLETELGEQREEFGRVRGALGEAAEKLDLEKHTAEAALEELRQAREALQNEALYDEYRRSYEADRESADPVQMLDNARTALTGRETLVQRGRAELSRRMIHFNAAFGVARPIERADNDDEALYRPYREERERLVETTLAEAEADINKAYEQARTQLAEDYLYRLYDSFMYVDDRVRELNTALKVKEIEQWGTYRFTATPRSDMKGLFDLVMNVGQFGRENLWSASHDRAPALNEEIDKLAASILNAGSAEREKEIERLRDYRGFYSYDYIWQKPNGDTIHYAAVTGVGSGGENQLPYYIAMFAAMHQVYRQGTRRSREPMCGLVLLDEAFSNMDDRNMGAAMAVADRLHLQLIINTPGDKTHTLIPHVGTTLVLIRDTSRTTARPLLRRFTREQAEQAIAALDGPTAITLQAG